MALTNLRTLMRLIADMPCAALAGRTGCSSRVAMDHGQAMLLSLSRHWSPGEDEPDNPVSGRLGNAQAALGAGRSLRLVQSRQCSCLTRPLTPAPLPRVARGMKARGTIFTRWSRRLGKPTLGYSQSGRVKARLTAQVQATLAYSPVLWN